MERGICEFCQLPVTGSQAGAFRVRGWEFERDQGGANHIAGKERQANRIAHVSCVEHDLKYGAQASLLAIDS
jgi:hypothetical protein